MIRFIQSNYHRAKLTFLSACIFATVKTDLYQACRGRFDDRFELGYDGRIIRADISREIAQGLIKSSCC